MTGQSHLVIGIAAAATVAAAAQLDATQAVALIAAAVGTAKLPDVDLSIGVKHRGVTHTIAALFLVSLSLFVVLSMIRHVHEYAWAGACGALIGYGAHMVADACTPHGIPAFAPIYREDVHLLPRSIRIVTGSWQEKFVVALLLAASGVFIAHDLGAL